MRDDATTAEAERLLGYLKGNREAARFIADLFAVLHFFDDVLDRDVEIEPERVYARLFQVLVDLPRNAFYAQHFSTLQPLIAMAITNWRVANALEDANEKLEVAFILRSDYANILQMCCLIVGGPEWAYEKSREIREWFHDERLEGYLENLRKEREARHGMLRR